MTVPDVRRWRQVVLAVAAPGNLLAHVIALSQWRQERNRIAREMHDTLLQGFTGIALQLVAVAHRVSAPGETVAALRDLELRLPIAVDQLG